MKKVLYDSVLVAHVNSTCGKGGPKEAIEFGGCLLDLKTLRSYEPFSVIIKPNSKITEHCTKMTGLAPEDVSSGASFFDAMQAVQDVYDSYGRPWAAYGPGAMEIIRRQCSDMNISYPFSNRFTDIRSLFAMMFNLKEEVPLRSALRKLRVVIPDGIDAQDKALNSAIVLGECLRGPSVLSEKFSTVVEVKRRK